MICDVCIILEGSYPYVSGGVSAWVHDNITRMQDTSFAVIYIGAHPSLKKKMHYKIPPNVVDFREIYLFDFMVGKQRFRRRLSPKAIEALNTLMSEMRTGNLEHFDGFVERIDKREFTIDDFMSSREGWDILCNFYQSQCRKLSFIDYFWTWRSIYMPFIAIMTADVPRARVYHSISTGYAGVIGALAKRRFNRPFILTEHGIYTKERKIDILQSDWISPETAGESKVTEEHDFLKEWWISEFSYFSRLAYQRADVITSLFETYRNVQIEEGAPPEKTRVIPNGIDVEGLSALVRQPPDGTARIGFMGRVVPIKDVKTFIRACKIVHERMKNTEFYIMGPTDEDEEYFRDCQTLVDVEGLKQAFHFTGKVDIRQYYPKMDVIVLTSISEAQPLVILEAGACRIPVVATDVGGCRDLLYGSGAEDELLGQGGMVTPVCNPVATAEGVLKILKDENLAKNMGRSAYSRVHRYYAIERQIANYQHLYSFMQEEIRWRA
ncbi:MAG TPA: GT4 family glycosyltransferase PelF [bacterium]|nr:GT4 family glycosyltransferase PelF [bacterium]